MFPRGAFGAKAKRERPGDTDATSDAIAGLVQDDPAKALVMTCFRRLVAGGYAEWHMPENGGVQLRFHTGETYLLAKTTITRIV